jgi:hypothetical protein
VLAFFEVANDLVRTNMLCHLEVVVRLNKRVVTNAPKACVGEGCTRLEQRVLGGEPSTKKIHRYKYVELLHCLQGLTIDMTTELLALGILKLPDHEGSTAQPRPNFYATRTAQSALSSPLAHSRNLQIINLKAQPQS